MAPRDFYKPITIIRKILNINETVQFRVKS